MENREYIDKVIEHMVRSTNIDYEKEIITFPSSPLHYDTVLSCFFFFSDCSPSFSFYSYCKNMFGLTEDEISYVWKEYKDIITDKINNGQ